MGSYKFEEWKVDLRLMLREVLWYFTLKDEINDKALSRPRSPIDSWEKPCYVIYTYLFIFATHQIFHMSQKHTSHVSIKSSIHVFRGKGFVIFNDYSSAFNSNSELTASCTLYRKQHYKRLCSPCHSN